MQARVATRLQEVGVPKQRARRPVRRIPSLAMATVMSRVPLGILLGLVIGVVDDLLMLPPVAGVVVGLLTSAPDALITKAYAPILVAGVVFSAAAGWIVGRVAGP